jgi:hypothetical protein
MNSRGNTLFLYCLVFLIWSCSSTQRFSALQLDILRPAKLDIPGTQKNVGIIYRNVIAFEDITGFLKYFDHADNPTEIFSENPVAYHHLEVFTKELVDKALDWVIKSYMVFQESNEIHALNTKDYISLLALRKREYQLLDKQLKN